MGARFTNFDAVTRFDLTDGDWVDFRSELSFAEQQQIESGAFRSQVDQKSREIEVDIDWSEHEIVRLDMWISAWSFTINGKPVPATKKNIRRLTPAAADELTKTLDAHIAAEEGDEGKDNSDASS